MGDPAAVQRPPRRLLVYALAPALLIAATPLWAAAPGGGESASEALLLTQIIILILTGRLLGEAMLRIGQPAVMGELLAGILLGPSVLGLLWPEAQHALFPPSPEQKAMIDAIAQFGILMLLLLAGMETDLALVRQVRRPAFTASIGGIALPFACGFALGEFLPDSLLPDPDKRLITALFLGTALSISSVKIVATVVREMGFVRRNVGQVILASAIVDDTIGWIIIATTLSLAEHGSFDWMAVSRSVLGTLVFLAVSFTFGRQAVFQVIRWTNDTLRGEAPVIAVILLIMGVMALITHLIGVHTVLGAFVAGILVGESPILTRQIDEQLRGLTAGLFMPVFFGLAGLSADLGILADGRLALLALGLILIASLGKASGAFAGGWFGGLTSRESLALATGMNARGSTEVIVASIGLAMGVVSQDLFTMIVAMALVTTMAMPPTLRWALLRLPIRKEEQDRLDREDLEANRFVPHLERVLVVADETPKGRFAARLAGLIAGWRGMPVTVLKFGSAEAHAAARIAADAAADDEQDEVSHKKTIQAAARHAEAGAAPDDKPVRIDVTEHEHGGSAHEAVAEVGRKGYDLLVVGMDRAAMEDGSFHEEISRIAQAYDGSLAVVIARGTHAEHPLKSRLSILAPISGSESSRHGAEVAMAMAKTGGHVVRALVISPEGAANQRRRLSQHRDEDEIVKEVRLLGRLYGKRIRAVVRTAVAADDAILREARHGRHNLIVIGVSRRPGERLSFGPLARALMESADRSLMFVLPRPTRRRDAGEGAQAAVAPKSTEPQTAVGDAATASAEATAAEPPREGKRRAGRRRARRGADETEDTTAAAAEPEAPRTRTAATSGKAAAKRSTKTATRKTSRTGRSRRRDPSPES